MRFHGVDGALDVGIEMHSLSDLQYDRVAHWLPWATPDPAGLATIKTNLDSGVFMAYRMLR